MMEGCVWFSPLPGVVVSLGIIYIYINNGGKKGHELTYVRLRLARITVLLLADLCA